MLIFSKTQNEDQDAPIDELFIDGNEKSIL